MQPKMIIGPKYRKTLYAIVALIVALFIFQAGVHIGFRRAQFFGEFGNRYQNAFYEPRRRFSPSMMDSMPAGHGAAGKIVSISLPTLVIETPDNIEKVILVSSTTAIRKYRHDASQSELQVADYIVALGAPNEKGQIEAKLLRILPPQVSNQKSK